MPVVVEPRVRVKKLQPHERIRVLSDGSFPDTEEEWRDLVQAREHPLATFLSWSGQMEASGKSLRLQNREDLNRVREILDDFHEPWWAAVVYTCFDSLTGTRAVAEAFQQPLSERKAAKLLDRIQLPWGSVQHHRTQSGHKGAKVALVAACAAAKEFRHVLFEKRDFDDRYKALRNLRTPQWGRTTCFDLLIRAGLLGVSGQKYRPEKAYLADSTGPRKGFTTVWGIPVTRENADRCEALLRGWSHRWFEIAKELGVSWKGEPYTPGDFENALCVFQEPGSAGYSLNQND